MVREFLILRNGVVVERLYSWDCLDWRRGASRAGDTTAPLDNLYLITPTVNFFLVFRGNLLCFNLFPELLVLSVGTTENLLSVLFADTL